MIKKDEIEALKELSDIQKEEALKAINIKLPEPLQKISHGLTFSEMKKFKKSGIFNLKEKRKDDGTTELLDNESIIYEVVVPLLEMRKVDENDLDNIQVNDLLAFYLKVETLTNNPALKDEIEKKN